MIQHLHKCVYVHIPRCGGTSVELTLGGQLWDHRLLSEIKTAIPKRFAAYFKFTFVRNTWDRLVSIYHFNKEHSDDPCTVSVHPKPGEPFDQYLYRMHNLRGLEERFYKSFFRSQLDWITIEDRVAVDFIGRFETLSNDFQTVCQRLQTYPQLQHVNSSRHGPCWRYYDCQTKDLVRDWYASEIDYFQFAPPHLPV